VPLSHKLNPRSIRRSDNGGPTGGADNTSSVKVRLAHWRGCRILRAGRLSVGPKPTTRGPLVMAADRLIRDSHEPLEGHGLSGEFCPQASDGGDLPRHRRPQDILTDIEHDIATIQTMQLVALSALFFTKASR
jgi:hypothetical protein